LWLVSQVAVAGRFQGTAGATAVRVGIYNTTGSTPGVEIASQLVSGANLGGNDTGDFVLTLNPPVIVGPGTYWVMVQAIKPNASGLWQWNERSTRTGAESAFKSTPTGSCPNWAPRVTVCRDGEQPDVPFSLSGSYVPVAGIVYLPTVSRR
jgi:hypothetical protein